MPAERQEMNWLHLVEQNVEKKQIDSSRTFFRKDVDQFQSRLIQLASCFSFSNNSLYFNCSRLPMKNVLGKVNNRDWVNANLAANPHCHTTGLGPTGTSLRSKHFTTEAQNKSVKKRTCSPCTNHFQSISKPFQSHFKPLKLMNLPGCQPKTLDPGLFERQDRLRCLENPLELRLETRSSPRAA